MSRRNIHLNPQRPRRIQFLQRPHQPLHRHQHRTSRASYVPRRRRPRLRQVIVHLPTHPLHLHANRRRTLTLPRRLQLFRLLRQHRQRRLQSMRQIARLRQRPPRNPLAMLQQRIEIVHQRLHFRRILPFDPLARAIPQPQQLLPQPPERYPRSAKLPNPRHDANRPRNQQNFDARRVQLPAQLPMDRKKKHMQKWNQPERPKKRPHQNPPPERTPPTHASPFIR